MLRCSPFCTYRLRLEDAVCIDRQSLIRCMYCLLLQDHFCCFFGLHRAISRREARTSTTIGVAVFGVAVRSFGVLSTPYSSTRTRSMEYIVLRVDQVHRYTEYHFTDTRYSEYFISDLNTTNKELYGLQYIYSCG
jgi:hypothetical protein